MPVTETKQLHPTTKYKKWNIKEEIYSYKAVGLHGKKIQPHNVVKIKGYSELRYISGRKAKLYPVKPAKRNEDVLLRVIPIADMKIFKGVK